MGKLIYASAYYDNLRATGANIRFDEVGKCWPDPGSVIVMVSPKNRPAWTTDRYNVVFFRFRYRILQALEIFILGMKHSDCTIISDLVPTIPGKRTYYLVHDLRQFSPYRRHKSLVLSWLYRINLSIQRNIITVSRSTKKEIRSTSLVRNQNIVVSHNGINESLSFDNKVVHVFDVFYVATFEPRKDHSTLIRALYVLTNKYGISDVKLLLVGRDLGSLEKIKELIEELNLTQNVSIIESCSSSELKSYFLNSTVFCSPALYEGFGMPVLEARSYGLPVVCSDIEVFREIGDYACTYFPPGDHKALASRLKIEIEKKGVYEFAEFEKYTWSNIAKKLYCNITRY